MANLAVTGHSQHGIEAGTYVLLVGDSNAGKTWLALAVLAEASINPAFDDYRLIYDGPENGALMDFQKCFGKKAAARIERVEPSTTVEEFYDRTAEDIKSPCIRILDSMDALDAEDDREQVAKEKEAREKGKEASGSYGTAKAKANSGRLRGVVNDLTKTGSILIIICQTRDNIGFGSMFNPKFRSGGKALKFYAHTELWLSVKETLKDKYKGKDIQIGAKTLLKVERSRHTGKKRVVEIPIYHSVGIDDIGAMVEFLVEWGHWKKTAGKIDAPEFMNGQRSLNEEGLCQLIDADPKGRTKLRKLTAALWNAIEKKTKVERKSPYE